MHAHGRPTDVRPTVSVLRATLPPADNAARRACGTADGWVVDTGASRHIYLRSAASDKITPRCVNVETANGVVSAAGETTVAAPGLGTKQALVLDDAPRLLSVGLLVRDGYALRWGPSGCSISRPG